MSTDCVRLPVIKDASRRRKRIARGSGRTVQEVNNLLRQYAQMRKMFKQMGKGNMMRKLAGMRMG